MTATYDLHFIKRIAKAAALAIAAGGVAALGGCQSAIPEDAPQATGLRYYAPKQVVVIDADVTEEVDRHVTGELTLDSKLKFKGTQATVSLRTLPETSKAYSLEITPGSDGQERATADLQSLVSVSPDGLLTAAGANASAGDNAARMQLVTDASHFPPAAVVAASDREGDANDLAHPIETVFNMTDAGRRLRGPEHETALLKFRQLPLPLLYFLQESQEGRELWDRGIKLDGLLAAHLVDRDNLYDRVTSASAGAAHGQVPADQAQRDLEVEKAKLEEMSTEIESLRKQRDGVDAAFQADLERLLSARQIGTSNHTTHYVVTLELTDLPAPALLAPCGSQQEVEAALQKAFPKALDVFRQTRIVVSLGGLPPTTAPAADHNAEAEAPQRRLFRKDSPRPEKATIYYRQASPAEVGVWAMVISPDAQNSHLTENLQRVDQESVAVLDPQTPAAPFTFDPASLASRGLVLNFDAEDRFAGLTPAATARPVGNRSAATEQQARIEAQLRLQRTTSMNQLEQQLHDLHRRADLLDCMIAMQSETVESTVLNQRSQLQQQIGALESKLEAMWAAAPASGEHPAEQTSNEAGGGAASGAPAGGAPIHASTMQSPSHSTTQTNDMDRTDAEPLRR